MVWWPFCYRLQQLGYGPVATGVVATSTLLGSALLTILLGFTAHRVRLRPALLAASLLMAGTGLGFAYLESFWPLMVVAFIGTLNPSGGDVSLFLPLEHTLIAQSAPDETRTAIYARYSFIGSVGAALGSLAAGTLDCTKGFLSPRLATGALFLFYGALGVASLVIYAGVADLRLTGPKLETGLGPSRRRVYKLAALFAVDAFGGGFIVNSLLALWLFQRFACPLRLQERSFLRPAFARHSPISPPCG
jgi:MFS family permease